MSAIYPSVTSHATDAQPLAANITTAGILTTNDIVKQLNCYSYELYFMPCVYCLESSSGLAWLFIEGKVGSVAICDAKLRANMHDMTKPEINRF